MDMRAYLDLLQGAGEIMAIEDELDPVYEVSAVLGTREVQMGPAVLFRNLKGYPGWQVVGNLFGNRRRVALYLGIHEDEVEAEFVRRQQELKPPVHVNDAPCKEVKVTESVDLTRELPILTFSEGDVAPYITAGIMVSHDPHTKERGVSVHRLRVAGPNRLGTMLMNPPLNFFMQKAEKADTPLEVAICIGPEPAVLLATLTRWTPGVDKYEIAGGIAGSSLEVVRCETVNIEVPAASEVVIEGRILPNVREPDGPFGEHSGCYVVSGDGRVVEVTAITRRQHPFYQVIKPWTTELDLLMALGQGNSTLRRLKEVVPEVEAIHVVPLSSMLAAVIKLASTSRARVRKAILTCLAVDPRIKQVVAVDDDIDITNPYEVAWAMVTRFQADRDVVILRDTEGTPLDPSRKAGNLTSKIGFDATSADMQGNFKKISPPATAVIRAQEVVGKYLRCYGS